MFFGRGRRAAPDEGSQSAQARKSVRRWLLDVIDDDRVDGEPGGFELEAKLFRQGSEDQRINGGTGWIGGEVFGPLEGEIVHCGEPGLVSDGRMGLVCEPGGEGVQAIVVCGELVAEFV